MKEIAIFLSFLFFRVINGQCNNPFVALNSLQLTSSCTPITISTDPLRREIYVGCDSGWVYDLIVDSNSQLTINSFVSMDLAPPNPLAIPPKTSLSQMIILPNTQKHIGIFGQYLNPSSNKDGTFLRTNFFAAYSRSWSKIYCISGPLAGTDPFDPHVNPYQAALDAATGSYYFIGSSSVFALIHGHAKNNFYCRFHSYSSLFTTISQAWPGSFEVCSIDANGLLPNIVFIATAFSNSDTSFHPEIHIVDASSKKILSSIQLPLSEQPISMLKYAPSSQYLFAITLENCRPIIVGIRSLSLPTGMFVRSLDIDSDGSTAMILASNPPDSTLEFPGLGLPILYLVPSDIGTEMLSGPITAQPSSSLILIDASVSQVDKCFYSVIKDLQSSSFWVQQSCKQGV